MCKDECKVRSFNGITIMMSLFICFVSLLVCPMIQDIVPSYGTIDYSLSRAMLRVDNDTIRNGNGSVQLVGVQYAGVNSGMPDVWSYAPEHSLLIKDYGFNVVRLPFYWNWMEISSNKSEFSYNYSYMTAFASAARIFTSRRLYVIVDCHTVESAECTSSLGNFLSINQANYRFEADFFADTSTASSAREHLKRFWLELTSFKLLDGYSLRNDPYVAGYDILNEPHHNILTESGTADERQELHERWYGIQDYIISSMRKTGDSHVFFGEETLGQEPLFS